MPDEFDSPSATKRKLFVALLVFLTAPFPFVLYFLRADPHHLSYTNTECTRANNQGLS